MSLPARYATPELRKLNPSGRRAMAAEMLGRMAEPAGNDARALFFTTWLDLVVGDGVYDICAPPPKDVSGHSAWDALASATLVRKNPARTAGYIQAIQRAARRRADAPGPSVAMALGAGCGSTALLELALATYFPNVQIQTYELDPTAARCARTMIKLMGYEDRISVIEGDVMAAQLPEAQLAVTETFMAALMGENGVAIARKLSQTGAEIIPAGARLWATDVTAGVGGCTDVWQEAGFVDFSTDDIVRGVLLSTGGGWRDVHVATTYDDMAGEPVVGGLWTDSITRHSYLGRCEVPGAGAAMGLSYLPGRETLAEAQATVRYQP